MSSLIGGLSLPPVVTPECGIDSYHQWPGLRCGAQHREISLDHLKLL